VAVSDTPKPSAEDRAFMLDAIFGYMFTQAIHVAAVLGLADRLATGPQTTEELADSTGGDPRRLFRLLRYLAAKGVFEHLDGDVFAHNARSALLRSATKDSVNAVATFSGSRGSWEAWGWLVEAVRSGHNGFRSAHGVDVFPWLEQHPEAAAVFNRHMVENPTRQIDLADAYDFRAVELVVDVGGGHGHHLASILKANPHASGILFDVPHVVAGAGPLLTAAGVADRCDVVAGDFFEAVPDHGDVYLLGNILHDWDHDHCVRILRNCRRAAHDQSKLLVVENVVPEGPGHAESKRMDLQMLVLLGGQERTEAEFAALLEETGFRLTRVLQPGSGASIVEAQPAKATTYDRLGGQASIDAAVDQLYDNVTSDPELAPFFERSDLS
jgi:hypothetical protein